MMPAPAFVVWLAETHAKSALNDHKYTRDVEDSYVAI